MSKLLLDTHILIWALTKSDELSNEVKEAIKSAKADRSLYLSSISLWEIAMLAQKQRRKHPKYLEWIEPLGGI